MRNSAFLGFTSFTYEERRKIMFSDINKLLYSLIRRFYIRRLIKRLLGYFAPIVFDQRR